MKLQTKDHDFDWGDVKAKLNLRKHGVSFETAASVFADELHSTLYDWLHSDVEDRWTTYGRTLDGHILSVSHTLSEFPDGRTLVRLISARPAVARERIIYERKADMIGENTSEDLPFGGNDPRQVFRGGHLHRDDGVLRMSIFLDYDILRYFIVRAAAGTEGPTEVINQILRRERARIESAQR